MNTQNTQPIMFGSEAGRKLEEFAKKAPAWKIRDKNMEIEEKEKLIDEYANQIDLFIKTAKNPKEDKEDENIGAMTDLTMGLIYNSSKYPARIEEYGLSEKIFKKCLESYEKLEKYLGIKK